MHEKPNENNSIFGKHNTISALLKIQLSVIYFFCLWKYWLNQQSAGATIENVHKSPIFYKFYNLLRMKIITEQKAALNKYGRRDGQTESLCHVREGGHFNSL